MSYSGSHSIGLLMPNANSYDYADLNPSFPFNENLSSEDHSPFWTTELGFTSKRESDRDQIGDNYEGEQVYSSCFEYSLNEHNSSSYSDICRDLFFNCQDPYGNQNGCRRQNTEDILHNEDYNDNSRYLVYESIWDCFQSWFGLEEDEHGNDWEGQQLEPEHDCSSDAMALLDAILGY